jgi:hypothetical protein
MSDPELARALERGELPNEGFHHADHLRVALVYLNESPSVETAVGRMASTLRRFAASVGKAEKYSQPVTEFWMYQMAAARAVLPSADAATLLRAYPRLLDKDLIHAASTRATDSPRDAPDRVVSRQSS